MTLAAPIPRRERGGDAGDLARSDDGCNGCVAGGGCDDSVDEAPDWGSRTTDLRGLRLRGATGRSPR